MANANTEKINFNVSPNLKRNVERLASSYGKTLSAFMLDVCNQIVKVNADRIKEQAEREKQPLNFGTSDVKPTTKTKKARRTNTKKAAQSDSPAKDADDND